MARRVGRPSSDDAVDTRAAILEQARKSFTAKGFTATTNREIAAAAGITTAAIYHYFPSKIEMYVAVFQDVQEQVYSALERAVDAHDSFLERFDAMLDAMFELGEHDPTLSSFVVGVAAEKAHHPELQVAMRNMGGRGFKLMGRVCAEASERGELPDDVDLQAVSDVLNSLIAGLARWATTVTDRRRHAHLVAAMKSMAREGLARAVEPSR